MSSLNAFIESLTNKHDKLVQMGIIKSSKYQALFASRPKDTKGKGKKKNKKTNFDALKPKETNQQQEEPSTQRNTRTKETKEKKKSSVPIAGRDFTLNMLA